MAHVRTHGTTKTRPVDRFAADQAAMRPLVAVPFYDVRPIVPRETALSATTACPTASTPMPVGRTVVVRPDGEPVGDPFTVYLGDRVVAHHRRQPQHSRRVTRPEHEAAIRHQARTHGAVRAAMPHTPVQQRSLEAYEAVVGS